MNYDLIRIDLEKSLSKELYDLFEGDIIAQIMKESRVDRENNQVKLMFEGHSFKIGKNLSPHLDDLCQQVTERLKFKEPIEFFVTNAASTNAMAIPRQEEDDSHLIVLNSGLIDKFDDDEIRFVLGHEIGHLISQNAKFSHIIRFVFPDLNSVALVLKNKISLWYKLSELTADRYGFIASPKLEKCVSNFFKLASGMDIEKIAFKPAAYLEEMDNLIEYFKKEPLTLATSHPVNPVRIKAIRYFSESELYKSIASGAELKPDDNLNKNISELIQLLMVISGSELDTYRTHFIASAGLLAASIDKQITDAEIENIVNMLSYFTIFPKKFLEQIAQSEKVSEIFNQSATAILQKNPGERFTMFDFLINVILVDREIKKPEIQFLYQVGAEMFALSKQEIAQHIGGAIQKNFYPKIYRAG